MEEHGSNNFLTRYQFRLLALVALITISLGTIIYHMIEKFDWIDSFYFSVITLTTIGYGDITPKTDVGKLFTVFYVIIGISIIGAFINALVRRPGKKLH